MKMFKLLTTTLLVVLCIGFVSCSKSDEPTSPIVGKWENVDNDSNEKYFYTFNADGTYLETMIIHNAKNYEGKGSYTFDASTLNGVMTENKSEEENEEPTKQTIELIKNKFNEEILVITEYTSSSKYKYEYSRVK